MFGRMGGGFGRRGIRRQSGPSSPSLPLGLHNFKSGNTAAARAAIARVNANEGNMTVLVVGESTSAGVNSVANLRTQCWSHYMVAALAGDLPCNDASIWGDAHVSTAYSKNYATYDPRVTQQAGWVFTDQLGEGIGGNLYINPTTAFGGTFQPSGFFIFTPGAEFDRYRIHYTGGDGVDLWTGIGGPILATIDTAGANAIAASDPIACTLGNNTIGLAKAADGFAFVQGVEVWRSDQSAALIHNVAVSGAKAEFYARDSQPSDALKKIRHLQPDLVFYCLGGNDMIGDINTGMGETAPEVFAGQLQDVIDAVQEAGDIILAIPPAIKIGTFPDGLPIERQTAITDVIRSLSVDNDIPLVDVPERIGPWSEETYTDPSHPTAAVYEDIGDLFADAFRQCM